MTKITEKVDGKKTNIVGWLFVPAYPAIIVLLNKPEADSFLLLAVLLATLGVNINLLALTMRSANKKTERKLEAIEKKELKIAPDRSVMRHVGGL